ncbi:MAG: DUF1282 family protein [Clostridia bacterium]|nr:DUF1282 family protein [Clostridia bacterium]
MKKRIAVMLVALLLALSITVQASEPFYSYTYSYQNGDPIDVAAPVAYEENGVFRNNETGCAFVTPEDLIVDAAGNFYIVDSGANCVFVLDKDFRLQHTITTFINAAGEEDTFQKPTGLFADADGLLYIADTANKRVVVLDKAYKLVRTVEEPKSELLDATFSFEPQKLVVDESGRMFVLVQNVNKGLMQFSPDGSFVGYIGSNNVVYTVVDLFWKTVMTADQRKHLLSFVPVEYSNISLDSSGFIYAVTSASDTTDPIRRLNPSGNDVLVRSALSGETKVSGDVIFTLDTSVGTYGPSAFVDITQDERGNYYALDGKRGRIFAYDEEGNLLFIFGGLKTAQQGSFEQPSAILYHEDTIYILDKSYGSVTRFIPTEYTTTIHKATSAYLEQDYETCIALWNDVIRLNSNFDLAYMKAGYAYYRLYDYEQAMEYFKIAGARDAYSKAYVKAQKIRMTKQFPYYVLGAAVLVAALVVVLRIRKKRLAAGPARHIEIVNGTGLKGALYILRHPIDGFWEMRFREKGSLGMALLLMVVYFVVIIIDIQARSFMFNDNYNTSLDLFYQLRVFLMPVALAVIANWSITTLMNGKGRLRDIIMVLGYSFQPLIIFTVASTLLTHVLSLNEMAYLAIFEGIGIAWFCLMVFIGLMEVHEYNAVQNTGVLILTVLSALVVAFICLLFFSLIQEITGFVYSIYREFTLRI